MPAVPMSLVPSIYGEDRFPNGWGDDVLVPLTRLHAGVSSLLSARPDIMNDPTMTEAARLVTLDKLYRDRVGKHVDATREALERASARLIEARQVRDEVFAPGTDPASLALAGEIRQALRGMNKTQRMAELSKARQDGNLAVMRAALNGPEFLTGVPAEFREGLKEQYVTQHFPEITALIEHADRLDRTAQSTMGALRNLRSTLFNPQEEALIEEAREKAERTAKHLH